MAFPSAATSVIVTLSNRGSSFLFLATSTPNIMKFAAKVSVFSGFLPIGRRIKDCNVEIAFWHEVFVGKSFIVCEIYLDLRTENEVSGK